MWERLARKRESRLPRFIPMAPAGGSSSDSDSDAIADALVTGLRSSPAIVTARRTCAAVVITSLFRRHTAALMPPKTHDPIGAPCWLAVVNHNSTHQHSTPAWIQVPAAFFDSGPKDTLLFKAMAPLLFDAQPVIFLDSRLTSVRCMSYAHILRAPQWTSISAPPHLFASAIPRSDGRGVTVAAQLAWEQQKAGGRLPLRLDSLKKELVEAQVALNEEGKFCATLWMAWRPDVISQHVARRWLHAMSRGVFSDKLTFAWASSVPGFRTSFTSQFTYIYSAEQRLHTCDASKGQSAQNFRPALGRCPCRDNRTTASARATAAATASHAAAHPVASTRTVPSARSNRGHSSHAHSKEKAYSKGTHARKRDKSASAAPGAGAATAKGNTTAQAPPLLFLRKDVQWWSPDVQVPLAMGLMWLALVIGWARL